MSFTSSNALDQNSGTEPAPVLDLTAVEGVGVAAFSEACNAVLEHLSAELPLRSWMVTRFDGERQLFLAVHDEAFGFEIGESQQWDESLCSSMLRGEVPRASGDLVAAGFGDVAMVRRHGIRAYLGVPICRADGTLFGTLCGFDPAPRTEHGKDGLVSHLALLMLLARLIAMALEADLERADVQRRLARAEHAAHTDDLTGLWNRRAWDEFLEIEQRRHERFGDPAAIVVLDLDQLKRINDTEGHAAGDDYLVRAAEALRRVTRATDIVARLGGDEFGVIAAHTGLSAVGPLLERVEGAFADVGVSASVGAAPYLYLDGFAGAWGRADAAMYEVKRRRRASAT